MIDRPKFFLETIREASRRLRISADTLRAAVSAGDLAAFPRRGRGGRKTYWVDAYDVDRWLEKQRETEGGSKTNSTVFSRGIFSE